MAAHNEQGIQLKHGFKTIGNLCYLHKPRIEKIISKKFWSVWECYTLRIGYMVIGYKVKSAICSIFGWYGTEWGFEYQILSHTRSKILDIWSILMSILRYFVEEMTVFQHFYY